MSDVSIPTKEELMVFMTRTNERLWATQEKLGEISDELGELFEDIGETLRPLIRDYYGLEKDSQMDEPVCPFATYSDICIPTEGVVACVKCVNNPKNMVNDDEDKGDTC